MTLRHKVLIVDDEPHIRRLIQAALARADYAVIEAENGRIALELVEAERPDIVLLDLGLPDRDGLELVPIIKAHSTATLIIVSAREATEEKVTALDLGADDYLTKPFDTNELLARVRVALRNRLGKDGGVAALKIGELEIDLMKRKVMKAGKDVHLTPKEYAVFAQLAQFPGRVITHKQIMDHVWPNESEHHVEYLRVLIRTLRQKIEFDPQRPQIIGNELGIGYRLQSPD
ncbi:MAG: response regulator transcription factor [Sphingobium sp.]|uniref:response regulator transcription factor n=1 Tax=Sphingobium sp. CECT 9361 TaxID=2845384 RepID=UPI001E297B3C|nr:response regulator transcription factor [Sphingobium sp. CECT 9361]CAH0356974.1 KDP operon transcriptional regulatory protein KdpE [Sphingobium sp. CECT 9361]